MLPFLQLDCPKYELYGDMCSCSIVLDAIGCIKWQKCQSQQNPIFYIQITFFPVGMLKICIATLDNCTPGMLITRKHHLSQVNMPMLIFCRESLGFLRKCRTKLSYNSFFTSQVLPSWLPGAVLPPAADSGLNKRVYICKCWWLWRGWVWQGRGQGAGTREGRCLHPYRTVLSVSKSQSLGRGRVQEETVKSCWSTASSGTKARLSPLKDIAGSKEQVKGKKMYKSLWQVQ